MPLASAAVRAQVRGVLRRMLNSSDDEMAAEVEAEQEAVIEEEEEAYHSELGTDLVLLCYSLVALILVAMWAERQHVPSSLAAVLVGAFLGLVLRIAGAESAPSLHSLLFFDEELFLYLLLPPIIFEAGFSLSRKFFFNNLATILLFAVVGTLLTTFIVGQACQIAGSAGLFRSASQDALDFRVPRDAYTFGALISATDPVATLSIMGAYKVDPLMFTLVAGESVLNDAVAIVLVRILQSLGPAAFKHPSAFLVGVFQFVWVSLGSVCVGLLIALPSAVLLKRVDMSHGGGGFELSLLLLLGYCAYPTAEAVHCSGILALFVCSVLMGHYHVHSLSARARAAVELTLKSIAHLTETCKHQRRACPRHAHPAPAAACRRLPPPTHRYSALSSVVFVAVVFMYMGIDLVAQRGAVDDMFDADMGAAGEDEARSTRLFVVFAIIVVPLARAIVIPPLVAVANLFRGRKRSLSLRETIFLVFAGLRGAIAYALARSSASAHQRTIVAATTAVVLFTTFVLGGTTRLMLRTLGMMGAAAADGTGGAEQSHSSVSPQASPGVAAPAGASEAIGGLDLALSSTRNDGGGLALRFQRLDAQWLQPIFGGAEQPVNIKGPPLQARGGERRSGHKQTFVELLPITGDASGEE